MYYELLRSLYLGIGSNADLIEMGARRALHVATALDDLIPYMVLRGRDVILTGNPGDGKSHLVRLLGDIGQLDQVMVEPDVSAVPTADVIHRWHQARSTGKRAVLCANEGPLMSLLDALAEDAVLGKTACELQGQLGRLVAASTTLLAPEPEEALLIDLADRSVLSKSIVNSAIKLVTSLDFHPPGHHDARVFGVGSLATQAGPWKQASSATSSAGISIELLASSREARDRLALIFRHAANRGGEHISFRALWSAISLAIIGGRHSPPTDGRGYYMSAPLEQLLHPRAQGLLPQLVRQFADPAGVPYPTLDDDIWFRGKPLSGEWHESLDELECSPDVIPADLYDPTDKKRASEALAQFAAIKRLVALFHTKGAGLIDAMCAHEKLLPSNLSDAQLQEGSLDGIRRLYLTMGAEAPAPPWLTQGLPLWICHSYNDDPIENRPHVAVAALSAEEFTIQRPVRVPWLKEALGELPDTAWLLHEGSKASLALTPAVLHTLMMARGSRGPLPIPETVHRYLGRLSAWEEAVFRENQRAEDHLAVLEQPRGQLVCTGEVQHMEGGARYV